MVVVSWVAGKVSHCEIQGGTGNKLPFLHQLVLDLCVNISHASDTVWLKNLYKVQLFFALPSVLWHCWLGDRKGIRLVKTLSGGVLAWLCLGWGADLHMAGLMPLPITIFCFSKSRLVYLSGTGSPR